MPPSAFNLPPGCTLRDIEGAQECNHQLEDGADAFDLVAYTFSHDDSEDRAHFVCALCGEVQERALRK